MATAQPTYELTYIVNGALSDNQIQDIVRRVNEYIEKNGGEIIEAEEWGTRRLAYPINKKRNGYYVNLFFHAPGDIIARFERAMQIEDDVLRYLTLRLDKKMLRHFEQNRTKKPESGDGAPAPAVSAEGGKPVEYIDYKNVDDLKTHINEQGKILPRRIMDVTAKQQRQLTRAIKRARHLAMLPFVADAVR